MFVDGAVPVGTDAGAVAWLWLLPFPANVAVEGAVVVLVAGAFAGCSADPAFAEKLNPLCVLLLAATFALLSWLSSDPTNAETASASADGFEIKSSRKLDAILNSLARSPTN